MCPLFFFLKVKTVSSSIPPAFYLLVLGLVKTQNYVTSFWSIFY